jgi:hypothetical protein
MKRRELPFGPPDRTVYPAATVYDASATVRVERLRVWPEGYETQLVIEAPQPRRSDIPLRAAFHRMRVFIYPQRPEVEVLPRRSRFGIRQPELEAIHVLGKAELHADLSDSSKSYSKKTVSGRYWLPQMFVKDAVFCWLIWPSEGVSDAIFTLDIKRWATESSQTPPDEDALPVNRND